MIPQHFTTSFLDKIERANSQKYSPWADEEGRSAYSRLSNTIRCSNVVKYIQLPLTAVETNDKLHVFDWLQRIFTDSQWQKIKIYRGERLTSSH